MRRFMRAGGVIVAVTAVVLLLASINRAADPAYHVESFQKKKLTDTFYAEGAAIGDLDRDGHADVIAGPHWYCGPDYADKHELYPPKPFDPKGYSDNFLTFAHDIDGDGWTDVLVIGFPGAAARWYRNPGEDAAARTKHWPVHVALTVVDNESPTFTDLTGDGKPEIVCMSGGHIGYAAPPEDPTKPWPFIAISTKGDYQKFTHGLGVGDVNGDGRMDVLEKGGWWEHPADWDGKSPWRQHKFTFSPGGGSQMFAYDVDGDGDNDVITALAAHAYGLAWYEQVEADDGGVTFKQHNIMTQRAEDSRFGVAFSQLHAVALADMDGDGLLDLVTGKRWWAHGGKDPGAADPAVLYWFRLTREGGKVEYVPHPIDNDSGVGTQVTVGDVNGDKLPDIVVGNKRGVFVHTHQRRAVSKDEYFWLNHPSMKAVGKTPQQTAAGAKLPEGFKMSVAVGEPDVHQPIAFTIDERGRLWVAENYSYPNWAPTGNDRVMIFEDTDGDGYFEKSTVFYDKLNFVSGIEVGFGGVYVGSPPNLLFIPDRDRDDKPDGPPEVLLDGWGHQDTHETLNSFIWGPDGWLYGCHGVFTHSRVGTPGSKDEERTPMNAGVWRYHPVRKAFEVFAHGTSNPWGVDFDEYGECFITACVIPHAFHIVPGGRYQRQAGQHFEPHTYDDIKTIADHRHFTGGMRDFGGAGYDESGGGHAHAGAMIYLGDSFPPEYRGKLFMNNIHGNRINMDVLKPRGSTFTASHGPDFMLAHDKWYRGLYLRSGPAGEVYASDWYDPRACHQQKPHDRTNGRIYRITYKDTPVAKVDLSKMSDMELVELQKSPNEWHVRTARRLLMERAASRKNMRDAVKRLEQMKFTTPTGPSRSRLQWASSLIVANTPIPAEYADLTSNRTTKVIVLDEHERAWMVRLSVERLTPESEIEDPDTWFKVMPYGNPSDRSPTVRRAVASALQRTPLAMRWALASGLLANAEDADDPMIPLLIWYGVEPLVGEDPGRALGLMDVSKMPRVNEFIVRRAAADEKGVAALVKRLGETDDAPQVRMIVSQMRKTFEGVAKAKTPDGWDAVYGKLIKSDDAGLRDDARFLAVRFGDPRIFPELRKVVMDGKAPMPQRLAAIGTLVSGGDRAGGEAFVHAMDVPPLRPLAIRGLAIADHPHTAAVVLDRYAKLTAPEKAAAIATLSGRPGTAGKLMEAIGKGVVPRNEVPVFAVRQMLEFKDDSLNALIDKHWGAIRALSADKAEQMIKWKTLLNAQYLATADAANGRAAYARACAACHTMFGVGGAIGPDLTGSNRADLDYVLSNVLDPSAEIGRDYQLSIFTLEGGRVVAGMVRGENETAVTVQTATEQTVVDKSQIKSRQTLLQSMMPEGLLATMQDSEVRDLVAYLRSPRQVPLPGEGPTIDAETGRVPGAVEGESLKVVKVTRGSVRPQPMGEFKADRWSGDAHLWWTDGKPGDELTLALPVKDAGRYELTLAMTMARDYAVVQLLIDGKAAGDPVDLFSKPVDGRQDVISTGPVSLGEHELKPGSTLGVKIVGANEGAEKRYMFAVDYVVVEAK